MFKMNDNIDDASFNSLSDNTIPSVSQNDPLAGNENKVQCVANASVKNNIPAEDLDETLSQMDQSYLSEPKNDTKKWENWRGIW